MITMRFKRVKSTKNTHLFEEVETKAGDNHVEKAVRNLYVQKDAFEFIGETDEIEVIIKNAK